MSRTLTPKDLAYESIANDFENYISDFDIARRLEVPVHTLIGGTTGCRPCPACEVRPTAPKETLAI